MLKQVLTASVLALSVSAFAQTPSAADSVKSGANKVGRATEDAFCMKGDLACAAQKGKHKLQNTGDTIHDKAKAVKKDATSN